MITHNKSCKGGCTILPSIPTPVIKGYTHIVLIKIDLIDMLYITITYKGMVCMYISQS
jgi:hypothetical protein